MSLFEAVRQLSAEVIALRSRCEALEVGIGVVGMKTGLDQRLLLEMIEKSAAAIHQARLERLENVSPEGAAMMDTRTDLSLLDKAFLDACSFIGEGPEKER